MPNLIVRKVAVLGAGVMGAQIAAHCINARVPVVLFDLPSQDGLKNGIVLRALDTLRKLNPSPLADPALAALIEVANYDDHLDRLKECDLVVEAIAERMDWKRALYAKVAPFVASHAIFATNTSGLSVTALSDGVDADLKARFCGVHFFNPPRYMHLVELIPTAQTAPDILDRLETFLTTTLGKGVVRALDTPNFIANRVGMFGMLSTMIEADRFGLAVDVVDDLTGSKLGRAKSGTFRTADVVGLDTMAHVMQTMQDQLQDDPFHPAYRTPAVVERLLGAGALGAKAGAGFYRKIGKDILRVDAHSPGYVPADGKADDFIARVLKEKDAARRMKALRDARHPQGQFLWAILRDVFHYAAVHLEAIADNARDVDFAMRWGYGWSQGPFELWQAAGWRQVTDWIREDIAAGKALSDAPLPDWVFDGPVAEQAGVHAAGGSWSPRQRQYVARSSLPVYARQPFRAALLGDAAPSAETAGATVFENDAVRIWHQDDDVLVLSFKTKMHVIGPDVIDGMNRAVDEAERRDQALVIWQTDAATGGPFSAGADLKSMLPLFLSGGVAAIEPMVHALQQAHMRIKYAQVPVIAAVAGIALGGGCELLLHAARRVACIESYIGLVEVGVGLVPAGGGLKEIALRAAADAKGNDILQFLKDRYLHAATAVVSKSALDARRMGYLQQDDVIVLHPYELLYVAKATARALREAGYRPPLRAPFPVTGRYGMATIMAQLLNMRDGGFISEHDDRIGTMIAEIVSGGDIEPGSLVDEQWLLDMERKAFMELLKHPKTQARIVGMMENGKPVRN